MRATVVHGFKGARDGDVYPRQFAPGETIEGDLARAMIASGHAKSLGGAPENKMAEAAKKKDQDGQTGGAAMSSSRRRGHRSGAKT